VSGVITIVVDTGAPIATLTLVRSENTRSVPLATASG